LIPTRLSFLARFRKATNSLVCTNLFADWRYTAESPSIGFVLNDTCYHGRYCWLATLAGGSSCEHAAALGDRRAGSCIISSEFSRTYFAATP
jgi:3-isopropylmalate dehydratase small subunit